MPESNDTPDGWSEAAAAKQSEALQGLRLQIDAVDRELLALLNRRASLSLEVGRVKANTSGPVFRPQRDGRFWTTLPARTQAPCPRSICVPSGMKFSLRPVPFSVPYPWPISAPRVRTRISRLWICSGILWITGLARTSGRPSPPYTEASARSV